ncbi:MAG: hypothetical protein WA021_04870 [Minisyncoccia bacterium]
MREHIRDSDSDWTGFRERRQRFFTADLNTQESRVRNKAEALVKQAKKFSRKAGEGFGELTYNVGSLVLASHDRLKAATRELKKIRPLRATNNALNAYAESQLVQRTPISALPVVIVMMMYMDVQNWRKSLPPILGSVAGAVLGTKTHTWLKNRMPSISVPSALFVGLVTYVVAGAAIDAYLNSGLSTPSRSPHIPDPKVPPPVAPAEPQSATTALKGSPQNPRIINTIIPETAPDPTILTGRQSVWSTLLSKLNNVLIAAELDLNTAGRAALVQSFQEVANDEVYQNTLLNRTGGTISWTEVNDPIYFDRLMTDPVFIERWSKMIQKNYPTLVAQIIPTKMSVSEYVSLLASRVRYGT